MSEIFVVKVKMLLQVSPHRPISVYDKINNLNLNVHFKFRSKPVALPENGSGET